MTFSHHRLRGAVLLLALLLLAGTLTWLTAPPVPAASAARARLDVSPSVYVGGQRLRWTGSIGRPGVRALQLQFNMGSVVGNTWTTVDGFRARTRADGSFSFDYPAPSMFNIHYRVVAGGRATPARQFRAKTQDLTIRLADQPDSRTNQPGLVEAGSSYAISVDTTPGTIYRSPESIGLPVLSGRRLTLQRRVDGGARWRTVARGTVGADGTGAFSGLHSAPGVAVYRVRQEDYRDRGNQIGWSQSFPLYVLVGEEAQEWYTSRYGLNEPGWEVPTGSGPLGRQPQTASQRYSWFPSTFDFAWEYGQSLSSPPSRGTRIRGHWIDYSDGSGRVSKYNGGLTLDSKRYAGAGAGDFGTTSATMTGNPMTYGRWETSLRIRNSFERSGADYQVLAELVPARVKDYDCGSHNVTIASISPFSKQVRVGVRAGRRSWSGSTRVRYTPLANAYNAAVEVTSDHITWLLNGAPVASVVDAAAIPRVPMTLRLSLQGDGDSEMNQTSLISDWQRGFPASTGRSVLSAKRLAATRSGPAC